MFANKIIIIFIFIIIDFFIFNSVSLYLANNTQKVKLKPFFLLNYLPQTSECLFKIQSICNKFYDYYYIVLVLIVCRHSDPLNNYTHILLFFYISEPVFLLHYL